MLRFYGDQRDRMLSCTALMHSQCGAHQSIDQRLHGCDAYAACNEEKHLVLVAEDVHRGAAVLPLEEKLDGLSVIAPA